MQRPKENHLEFAELLDSLASSGKYTEDIESDLDFIISNCPATPFPAMFLQECAQL